MSGNKRYTYNPYELWVIDNKRDKEYYSIEEITTLLNGKEERIRELEKENERLKGGLENEIKYKLQAKNAWKERYGDMND